ncbi:SARP family transcriptional regulator [Streptomyces radicis]|uniref:SARP family transcriptional regulator n=1 Tax=Streptomyces radicis TaxID=1750517 RepID=A0A3A9WKS6_9ACTN|nr:BTAD domain-containing putative transcriptional regulator [Streptomyces radicis]RKN12903.1 SARP family transcriptional regulator [Streptomyces radicis]RKN27885.1 SARP family transcriptional regulator [Streptomyces radicis]
MDVDFGVLGPVIAWGPTGEPLPLKGPRHRAVLARLLVARRRVVPVARLVRDLWPEPPADAVGAIRTFVAGLRRAIEPDRPPRAPSRLLVTEGPGYALRPAPDRVDAWRFDDAVRSAPALTPPRLVERLADALDSWRGPAYADFADEPWARAECARLAELRLRAVERLAEARIAVGAADEAAADLDGYVAEHPWREGGWHLLALALYRSGRQADALAVLRGARRTLGEQLGIDPGPALRRLEADILRQADHLDPGPGGAASQVWALATAAYENAVPSHARTRLESTAALMRDLAVTGGGGLTAARRHRAAAVAAADRLGDPELTARVIGLYDVPANWTRSDEPAEARRLVDVAERTLRLLPAERHDAARARLLATIAVESRGALPTEPGAGGDARPLQAARQAERIARRLNDAALLAFALNGVYMQTFASAGLAPERDAIGAELVSLATPTNLVTHQVLGHLVRLQSRCAVGDFAGADRQAAAADELAGRHELPLVSVFTTWYRALRVSLTRPLGDAEAAYEEAAALLEGAGMPGLERGLPPLARLCLYVRHDRADLVGLIDLVDRREGATDWGPYEPWARPVLLAYLGDREEAREEARAALRDIASPPRDLLFEALWCLLARAALRVGERRTMRRAFTHLEPAAAEWGGAQSGLLTLGPVSTHLDALAAALKRP